MFSIVIPAYNEDHHIYENLLAVHAELSYFCDDFEIILVNDGSRDDTLSEAMRAAEQLGNTKVITYSKNGGKGNAIKEGFKNTSKDLITFFDADLDILPQQIEPLFNAIRKTGADVAIQSKRHQDSVVNGFPLRRQFLSRSYNLITRLLFNLPVSDTQVGIKLYRRKVLDMIMPKLLVKRFATDVEQLVLAHKYGFKIAECPVHINFNPDEDRIGLKDIFNIGWDTAAVYYRLNILKYYDKLETVKPDKAEKVYQKDCMTD
jgi:glycosyltransferase involved in cell wall biosynthesis